MRPVNRGARGTYPNNISLTSMNTLRNTLRNYYLNFTAQAVIAAANQERETRAADVLVNPDFGNDSGLDVRKVAALPMVTDAAREQGVSVQPLPAGPDDVNHSLGLAPSGGVGYTFARPHLLHRRLPRAGPADHAAATAAIRSGSLCGTPIHMR